MLNTSSVFGDRLLYVTTIDDDTILVLDLNDWTKLLYWIGKFLAVANLP